MVDSLWLPINELQSQKKSKCNFFMSTKSYSGAFGVTDFDSKVRNKKIFGLRDRVQDDESKMVDPR